MSTKTTFKRIALVAVAALGFGMLSVVPSQATAVTAASIVVGEIPASRVGTTSYVPVKVYLTSATVASDTITINAEITSAPIMGGTANAASILGVKGTDDSANDAGALLALSETAGAISNASTTEVHGRMDATRATGANVGATATGVAASHAPDYAVTAANISAGYFTYYVAITPDVVGSYTVLVSTNTTSQTEYIAGDASASFTITTGGAPTGVVLTTLGGGTINTAATVGNAIAVSLVGGSLSGLESITLTASGSGVISKASGVVSAGSYAATKSLTSTDFVNGRALVWLKDPATAAETITLTAAGSGTLPSSVTATKTYSVVLGAGSTTKFLTLEAPSATADYAMTNATQSTNTITVTELSTSQKVGFTTPAAMTAQAGFITVTDSAGTITGIAGLVYDVATSFAATTAAAGGAFSFAASGAGKSAGTTLFTVAIPTATTNVMGVATGVTKTFVTAARANSAFTVSPNATILAAPGAAVALTVTLKDQFGAARSNQTVTITTTGRNNPAATTAVTDASGKVTFTTADASTSTTSLVDTVTFSASGATSSAATINYGNTAVGTVTVTGGNTTASVTAATETTNDIAAGDGVEAGAIDIVATVKDASANAIAGIPVTFTVAGTGVAFKSTSATKYTGSTGTATGSLYAWIAGTYTYTVTAGGKTTTGTATFGQTTATEARVISATVEGNVVTGKAVDRLGNPVSGVTLYASTTAPANIGGSFVANAQTGADGTAKWVVTNSGSVTVSAVNPTSVAGTTFGQTCALAGNLTCAVPGTDAEAFTASTVGTATTAETYVGASFAPAGVASASVEASDVTASNASDAAAEATDAANAATDAANAAAEAADAATAAAQDAADAVAALSTEVTELISALRKQITSLTNLVIKIQKKVKA